MSFKEKMQSVLKSGVTTSKKLADEAGKKATELGNKGVLKLENAELKIRVERLIAKLGGEVYAAFVEMDHATVSRETGAIREVLAQIKELHARIDGKEKEYKAIGAKA